MMTIEKQLWSMKALSRNKRTRKSSTQFDREYSYSSTLLDICTHGNTVDSSRNITEILKALIFYLEKNSLLQGVNVLVNEDLSILLGLKVGDSLPVHSLLTILVLRGAVF